MVWRVGETVHRRIRSGSSLYDLNSILDSWVFGDFIYWPFGLGYRRPLTYLRMLIEAKCVKRTFSIEKGMKIVG